MIGRARVVVLLRVILEHLTTKEAAEYPGCVRWGGGFFEYNGHTNEAVGCKIGGEAVNQVPPACMCGESR